MKNSRLFFTILSTFLVLPLSAFAGQQVECQLELHLNKQPMGTGTVSQVVGEKMTIKADKEEAQDWLTGTATGKTPGHEVKLKVIVLKEYTEGQYNLQTIVEVPELPGASFRSFSLGHLATSFVITKKHDYEVYCSIKK